jgi:DNA-binding response OmpR family regulator
MVRSGTSVPVIYMTANDNPAVRLAGLESGCLAYLAQVGLEQVVGAVMHKF